jgi:hypothetical protein
MRLYQLKNQYKVEQQNLLQDRENDRRVKNIYFDSKLIITQNQKMVEELDKLSHIQNVEKYKSDEMKREQEWKDV